MNSPGGQGFAARAVGGAVANMAAGAQGIAAGAHNLSAAASAGKLSLDPAVGKSMTEAIDKMLLDITQMKTQLATLGQAPRIGSSPDALAMAKHTAEVGTGSHSAQDALNGLQQALNDLKDGIKKSMDNYGHIDTGNAQNLGQIRH